MFSYTIIVITCRFTSSHTYIESFIYCSNVPVMSYYGESNIVIVIVIAIENNQSLGRGLCDTWIAMHIALGA